MALKFKAICLDGQALYHRRLAECSQITSDYSFINLWGWAEEYGLEWAWDDDLVWLRQTRPDVLYWAPIGPWEKIDWLCRLEQYGDRPLRLIRVPEKLIQLWQDSLKGRIIAISESREYWDYLYAASDLIGLEGNRYHKKKNLLNQFKKKYDYTYLPFNATLIDHALAMQEDWCMWRDCESSEALAAENRVISRVFKAWGKLQGMKGGSLYVKGEMVAYTVAESLPNDTLLIHFEKGNSAFKGVYQAISQIFLENQSPLVRWVNREQDLGDAGLRKAKLSYHPVDFLRKYRVNF